MEKQIQELQDRIDDLENKVNGANERIETLSRSLRTLWDENSKQNEINTLTGDILKLLQK